MKILVTGGAGFIGSAVVRQAINDGHNVINLDKLTYAACLENLDSVCDSPNYAFEQIDICDGAALAACFEKHQPDAIMHLAAESHVDRSIDGPSAFMHTNIIGTYEMLEAARAYWDAKGRPDDFRFHHIQQTRFMDHWVKLVCSPKTHHTIQIRHILHPRHRRIIWYAHGMKHTACPLL